MAKKRQIKIYCNIIITLFCEGLGFAKGQNRVRGPSGAFGEFSEKGSIVSKLCSNKHFATFWPQNCEGYPLFCEGILRQFEGSRRGASGRISQVYQH
jgi:hypothetical protein